MQSQVSGKRLLCSKVWHQLLSCISSQGAWVTDPGAGALAAGSSGSASENPRRFLGWSLIVRPFQIKYNRGCSNPLGTSHVTRCLLHGFEAVKAKIQKSCALPSIKQHRLGPFRAPRAPRGPRAPRSSPSAFRKALIETQDVAQSDATMRLGCNKKVTFFRVRQCTEPKHTPMITTHMCHGQNKLAMGTLPSDMVHVSTIRSSWRFCWVILLSTQVIYHWRLD